ncbi:lipopolysaccharide assembly protein LapA domain-containing protein [Novosphingobium sp.]|uniref:lipopolysaccharide assembly protein LapA domain-containing protein n=1 Tax=Novosphingobium sp. TaxID=1874826 RepID=UPI0035B2A0A1
MQVIRTIVWVLVAVALLLFSVNNWQPVEVKIWEDLVLETRLPALVVLSFLLGLVPMWLLSKAGKWRLTRRINALENSIKAAVTGQPSNIATTTQLDAAAAEDPKN